mgnify:CR=1 FL=1
MGLGHAARPRHVGHEHDGAHDVLHRFGQVGRRLQRLDHRRQRVGIFQVGGVEVQVQQGQRFHQFGVVHLHQRREMVHRGGKAGHPGQHAFGGRGLAVERKDPGVEPLPLADGLVQLGVAALHQRQQFGHGRAGWRRATFDVGDIGQALRGGRGPRLQQHAAQEAVDRAHVQRFQWGRQSIEQGGQALQLGWLSSAWGFGVLAGGLLATRLGGEFIPRLDEGDLSISAIRPASVGISEVAASTGRMERVLLRFPEVLTVVSRSGISSTEFQAPQSGQRPAHLLRLAPQPLQT